MRIAHVSEHASPLAALGGVDAGGQNVHVAALGLALARLGHEVVVYTRRDDPDLPERVPFAAHLSVHHIDAGPPEPVSKDDLLQYMPAFARRLTAALRSFRPALVHTHFWMSGWAGLQATTALGLPLVHTFHALGVVKRRHQGERDTSPAARLGHEVELARRCDRIVATAQDEVRELLALGASGPSLTVVPCGVDLDRFTPSGPAEPRGRARHRLIALGRLVERKGMADAIRAVAELDDTELVVAGGPPRAHLGSDPEARRLRAVAADLGVTDRVDFRGRVRHEDVPALLRSADAVVCVPWYEPFGIVPVEAMACGVPVVATAVGGMLDTVVHGRTGVHVQPRGPAELAGVLRGLLDAPEVRARMGRAGRRRALHAYGWDRVADATAEVYREVLGGARQGRHTRAVGQ